LSFQGVAGSGCAAPEIDALRGALQAANIQTTILHRDGGIIGAQSRQGSRLSPL